MSSSAAVAELLAVLAEAGMKAATFAKALRADDAMAALLVEAKADREAGGELLADFKTIGDVLIQQLVTKDVTKRFPEMAASIFGEEDNTFTVGGETRVVSVMDTPGETQKVLEPCLGPFRHAAAKLASAIHSPSELKALPGADAVAGTFDPRRVGVWIDPIDSTTSFVKGGLGTFTDDIADSACLPVATILIGAFSTETGLPLVGVVVQPFFEQEGDAGAWRSRCIWGVCPDEHNAVGLHGSFPERAAPIHRSAPLTVHSKHEQRCNTTKLAEKCGHSTRAVSGAGYKCLCVIDDLADLFFTSLSSTYKWDLCGPHAILRAMGGDVLRQDDQRPLTYHQPDAAAAKDKQWANQGGFIAFRSKTVYDKLVPLL